MKNALIKVSSSLLFIFIAIGCKKEATLLAVNNCKDSINADGIFFTYPYNELCDVLRISNEDSDKILLYKELTKKNLKYYVKFNRGNIENSFLFPFYREVQDYEPYLSSKMDDEIEKLNYTTPKNCFVIKLEYGTGHIRWNYLYEFNNGIKLKDIFYMEPRKKYIGEQDTLMYTARFKIDRNIKDISTEMIKEINDKVDYHKLEEEKWITK